MEQVSKGYSLEQHVEGESRHLGAPLVCRDLAKEMDELRRGAAWETNGHIAKTLVEVSKPANNVTQLVHAALAPDELGTCHAPKRRPGGSIGKEELHSDHARITIVDLTAYSRALARWENEGGVGPQAPVPVRRR